MHAPRKLEDLYGLHHITYDSICFPRAYVFCRLTVSENLESSTTCKSGYFRKLNILTDSPGHRGPDRDLPLLYSLLWQAVSSFLLEQ